MSNFALYNFFGLGHNCNSCVLQMIVWQSEMLINNNNNNYNNNNNNNNLYNFLVELFISHKARSIDPCEQADSVGFGLAHNAKCI